MNKIRNLEQAKISLKEITNRKKELKKKNNITNRRSDVHTVKDLFKKYHDGRFTVNKVLRKNGKKILGDAGEYFILTQHSVWIKGYIFAKMQKMDAFQNNEVKKE